MQKAVYRLSPLAVKLGSSLAVGTLAYFLFNRRRPGFASISDSLKIGLGIVMPTIAMGPIIRRPKMLKLAEISGAPTLAIKILQQQHERYGQGPLMLRLPIRNQAVILDADHVRQVLDETPEPFATASSEKRAALRHFEPKVSLISHGPERDVRRRLNEETLQQDKPVHPLFARFLQVVDEEMHPALLQFQANGSLEWREFKELWYRIVRRVVFGDSAKDDTRIMTLMEKLRADGNWAFLKPVSKKHQRELHASIKEYLLKSEQGSLAAFMMTKAKSQVSAPENQIPQWLFAFDPTGMAIFRTLALLAVHPSQLERARLEADGGHAAVRPHRPFIRACILESLRLWPTTPLLLRQTTRETKWQHGMMPKGTGILIYTPFFHRDDSRIPFAHKFKPEVWMEDDPDVKGNMPKNWPFVPFSGGTGVCPGRNLVLMLASATVATIVGTHGIRLEAADKLNPEHLPGMLDHFTLSFEIKPMAQNRAKSEMAYAKP